MTEEEIDAAFKRLSGYISRFRDGDFIMTPDAVRRTEGGGNPVWIEEAVADTRSRANYGEPTTFRMNRYDNGDHEIVIGISHCGIVVGVSEDDIRPYINLAIAVCPACCWEKAKYLNETGFLPGRR